ncbi:hypothetical protein [Fusibacter sp. JL216-2]|uniref:hypothetical protein n=1 Tax=Fusibacter sp. JL216-2 TaxID=3071453 RepID=UPI003D33935E
MVVTGNRTVATLFSDNSLSTEGESQTDPMNQDVSKASMAGVLVLSRNKTVREIGGLVIITTVITAPMVDKVNDFVDGINSFTDSLFNAEAVDDSESDSEIPDPTGPSQLQQQVNKGQAPRGVDRVDKPHVPGQKPHVHFDDGTSINNDGTIHDKHRGTPDPSKKVRKWLEKNGWQLGDY